VPPLRHSNFTAPLAQARQSRSGSGIRNWSIRVFTWGRETRPVKMHLRHRWFGWNPVNGVGGGTRRNALSAFDAYPTWGSVHIGERMDCNAVREVGSVELFLSAT
jgi:hypothetical protein